ncbi:MAG: pyruvate kinase [Phycisphaerales bacterium JB063]
MPDRTDRPILTKILATLGPASANVPTASRLIEEGARVFRINFSHGTIEQFKQTLDVVRQASEATGEPVAALGDLSGPKIRMLGVDTPDGTLELEPGDHVEITRQQVNATRDPGSRVVTIGTTYPDMVDDAEPGQRLLINDGAVRMLITDKVCPTDDDADGRRPDDPRLICSCMVGGTLSAKKGINLPDSDLSAPSLTTWDRKCAAWAVAAGFDYLALSFVRTGKDIDQLKTLLADTAASLPEADKSAGRIPIIAKIEMPQAIRELDSILASADGVMVARGDLGVEMDLPRVPILQKQIIQKAHAAGKPAIVATQMLESMIESATPTRAEVGDVANAILDGADATMLSGETAVGQYPVQAVNYMARTAAQAEAYYALDRTRYMEVPRMPNASESRPEALAHGVAVIVRELGARCVVMWTQTGGGVRYMSQARLPVPVVALCPDPQVLRRLALLFGVHPVLATPPQDAYKLFAHADEKLLERRWAEPGDPIVMVRGWPMGVPGTTNTVQVHHVADVCRI